VDGPGYIPLPKLAVINRAALDACDGNDGLVDGIIVDPPSCDFDPASIRCHGPDEASCLTDAQADTVRKIYEGAKFNDGTPIYSGFERGSELTWAFMIEKEPFSVNLNYFKGLVFEDPDWDFRTFDVDRDTRLGIEKTGKAVDGINPNLKPFRDAGGKIMMVSSWNSLALPPRSYVEYYKDVAKTMGGYRKTQDFARLFTVPASDGCPAFGNPQGFKTFDALVDWVENDKAPDRIIYPHTTGGGMMSRGPAEVYRTRPVCPYPEQARYKGSGDVNDAANFECVDPGK
jgi:feruloyl esterase